MAPQAGRKVMQWTDNVHTDILIAMKDSINFTSDQWDSIMNTLEAMGYEFTESALKQHIQKLKRKEKEGGASTPGTPAATPSGKGRKRAGDTPGPNEGTPSKKGRGKKAAGKKEKSEEDKEDSKLEPANMDDDIQEEC